MKSFHFIYFFQVVAIVLSSSINQTLSCDENTGTCINSPNNIEYYVEKRNRLHPMVELLSETSTAMSAKFRSLSGRNIQVFWDDGGEGVEQAHLSPGMVTTTNTYEGHSFFATPEDDKSKVLNRFTISKEKVSHHHHPLLLVSKTTN
jgi:hypothetical protein